MSDSLARLIDTHIHLTDIIGDYDSAQVYFFRFSQFVPR